MRSAAPSWEPFALLLASLQRSCSSIRTRQAVSNRSFRVSDAVETIFGTSPERASRKLNGRGLQSKKVGALAALLTSNAGMEACHLLGLTTSSKSARERYRRAFDALDVPANAATSPTQLSVFRSGARAMEPSPRKTVNLRSCSAGEAARLNDSAIITITAVIYRRGRYRL